MNELQKYTQRRKVKHRERGKNTQRPWQHQADFLLLLFEIGSLQTK